MTLTSSLVSHFKRLRKLRGRAAKTQMKKVENENYEAKTERKTDIVSLMT